jgi:hypothetical protein
VSLNPAAIVSPMSLSWAASRAGSRRAGWTLLSSAVAGKKLECEEVGGEELSMEKSYGLKIITIAEGL